MVSEETEEAAIDLAITVRRIHAEAGFEIRNWLSNSSKVAAALNGASTEEKDLNLTAELANEKVLGMWWNTTTDCFTFKLSNGRFDQSLIDGSRRPTKREVLRVLMSIYDPLGLISHYMMFLKVTLQDVWRTGIHWDAAIEEKQFKNWKTWVKLLPNLEKLSIPRCYRQVTSACETTIVQMHTMVDASINGMAAVVYLRFEEKGKVECVLVTGKTRVAPLKYLSIPRLELQAAVLGCRLAESVSNNLSIKISRRLFWTDNRDVLC